MTLLALILAFAIFHWVEKPKVLCDFGWLTQVNAWLRDQLNLHAAVARFVLLLALPLLLLTLLLSWFDVNAYSQNNIGFLLIHALILYGCLGPKSMDSEVSEDTLLKSLGLNGESTHQEIIEKMTDASLRRWFAVFIWYVILGLWGALIYRLCERSSTLLTEDDELDVAQWLLNAMNFPAAVLMAIALAVASDFEKVWNQCKPYLKWETVQGFDGQFIYDAMYVSVEQGELESQEESVTTLLHTTLVVLKRMLIACLVFVALLVLFSVR